MAVFAREARHERRYRLGELVAEGVRIGRTHAPHSGDLRRRARRRAAIRAGDQQVDLVGQRRRRRDRVERRRRERRVVVLADDQNRHQTTPASSLSFATSSATLPTFVPASRFGGSDTLRTSRRGVGSTP